MRRALVAALLLMMSATAWGAAVQDINFNNLPNDSVEILLQFDGTPPEPAGYSIDQPARIALDLMGVTSNLDSKYHNLGTGNTRSVTVVEAQDRTRVIVNLVELVGWGAEVQGNVLKITVGEAGGQVARAPSSRGASARSRESRVEEVDFRRGEDGEGRVVVRLSNPNAPVDVRGEGDAIRVEISGTSLPVELRRRLDVTDFATPVASVDAVEEGGHTVITVRPQGEFEYLAYQADNVLTINVSDVDPSRGVGSDATTFQYQGERLSLNFQDIEVRSVLQLIADFTDLNLVASDTVSGSITLRLQNVPWDQALDIILRNKGLDQRRVGNVLMVAPAAEIAARERQELDNQRQFQELAPLRTEFIQVLYAAAGDMVSLFQAAGGEEGLLTERGSIIVDDRTNSIIVTETAEKITEIRRILAQLDVPIRQVQIEARIVTANTNFTESLGITWGGGTGEAIADNFLAIGGSQVGVQSIRDTNAPTGQGIAINDQNFVDLGLGAATSSFSIGLAGRDYILDLELSALASDGHAEVVARPKVITADKQTASISSGVQIPYQEASSSGASTTSFEEAVLSLEVTPQITPDDRIIMDLVVNQDSVGQVFNGIPSINTNEVATQVLVDNGQTLVLGGIFTTSSSVAYDRTPFLGDLPLVGQLFRRTVENDDKQELLIFITPRIIQDVLTSR